MNTKRNLFALVAIFLIGLTVTLFVSIKQSRQFTPPSSYGQASLMFAKALRENDPVAYAISDAELHIRLDEWMREHKAQKCVRFPFENFGGGGRGNESGRVYDDFTKCELRDGRVYDFEVYNIQVEIINGDYVITDWVRVEEHIE